MKRWRLCGIWTIITNNKKQTVSKVLFAFFIINEKLFLRSPIEQSYVKIKGRMTPSRLSILPFSRFTDFYCCYDSSNA